MTRSAYSPACRDRRARARLFDRAAGARTGATLEPRDRGSVRLLRPVRRAAVDGREPVARVPRLRRAARPAWRTLAARRAICARRRRSRSVNNAAVRLALGFVLVAAAVLLLAGGLVLSRGSAPAD